MTKTKPKKAPAKTRKVKPKAKAKTKSIERPPENFMTRLLKRQEAERLAKTQAEPNLLHGPAHGVTNGRGHEGFGRFVGPRRRSAS